MTETNTGQHVQGLAYAPRQPFTEQMEAFDALPEVVRDAIRHSPYRYNVRAARQMLSAGRSPIDVAARISEAGRRAIALAYAERQ